MLRNIFKISNSFRSSLYINSFSTKASNKAHELFQYHLKRLEKENISEATNSLELIFAHVLNKKLLREVRGENLSKISQLSENEVKDINEKVDCRLCKMPIQYILKSWEFRDLELKMRVPVFITRPETEELVSQVLSQLDPSKDYRILELCSGCGAISLALLNELPNVKKIIAIDQSKAACELTLENAQNLGFESRIQIFKHKILEDDLLPEKVATQGNFDLIVCNPPYVPKKDLLKLDPEIYLYEDLRALDGGNDGLDIIKVVLLLAAKYLKSKGHLWLEVDSRHPEIIQKIVENNQDEWQLRFIATYKDIFKKNRFVEIEKI